MAARLPLSLLPAAGSNNNDNDEELKVINLKLETRKADSDTVVTTDAVNPLIRII